MILKAWNNQRVDSTNDGNNSGEHDSTRFTISGPCILTDLVISSAPKVSGKEWEPGSVVGEEGQSALKQTFVRVSQLDEAGSGPLEFKDEEGTDRTAGVVAFPCTSNAGNTELVAGTNGDGAIPGQGVGHLKDLNIYGPYGIRVELQISKDVPAYQTLSVAIGWVDSKGADAQTKVEQGTGMS